MADVDASGRGDVKRPIESTAATGARVQSGEGVFTVKNPEGEFDHQRYDASYDHSPYVSFNAPGLSVPSGGSAPVVSLNANTFNHPFKITQEEDDATGLIKTNIYYGVLRYCINSFNTVLEDDTHSVESYHATEKTDGQSGRPDRKTGDVGAHTHTLGGSSGLVNSGSYSGANHTHSIDSGVTVSLENSHNHTVPNLTSATPTVDRFVTIKNQIAATGIIKDVGPTKGPGNTTFGFVNNADGDQTVNRVLTLPAGTFGSIFLKWKVILPSDQNLANNFNILADHVEIHVDPDVAKTAESLSSDDTFTELKITDATAGDDAGIDDTFDRRVNAGAGENEADRTAYFYVKLGVTHNPAGGGLKAVEQITYENVYWSPLILGRAYGES